MLRIFQVAFPNVDINAPGFSLQIAFLAFGYLGTGLAAARLVNGWADDEGEGHLEFLLATSVGRVRWFLGSAAGVFVAIVVVAAVIAIGIALGVASTGGAVLEPLAGTATLVLYGAAVAGIAFAVAGLWRSSAAGTVGIVVAVGTMLLDLIVPALKLPDWIHNLALTAHYGQPLVGSWNLVGVGISLGSARRRTRARSVGFLKAGPEGVSPPPLGTRTPLRAIPERRHRP